MGRSLAACVFAVLIAAPAAAQPPTRVATTVDALATSPVFFHGKQVVVRHEVTDERGLSLFSGTRKPIYVFWRERGPQGPDSEVRGEFWDLGRLEKTDPRISSIDFTPILQATSDGQWPARDRVFVLLNATSADSPLPVEPTLRAIALAPDHYAGKNVSVTGRFRGLNLFGDLPQPVAKSRWDFVIQSADAAVWVTGLRPKGKDFDLDINSRIDARRWIEVRGVLRHEGALTWIEAASIQPATAPTEAPVEVTMPPPPPEEPPHVIFTAPLANDTEVEPNTLVRIQFSRDMEGKSFANRVHVSYAGNVPPGAPAQPPAFTVKYIEGSRGIEIKFAAPLDRFRQVKIELTDGITSAVDHQALTPYALTFMTGG